MYPGGGDRRPESRCAKNGLGPFERERLLEIANLAEGGSLAPSPIVLRRLVRGKFFAPDEIRGMRAGFFKK